jgi:hypothetical protein
MLELQDLMNAAPLEHQNALANALVGVPAGKQRPVIAMLLSLRKSRGTIPWAGLIQLIGLISDAFKDPTGMAWVAVFDAIGALFAVPA